MRPPRRSVRTPEAHVVRLDAQSLEVLGEHLRAVHLGAVSAPSLWGPQLELTREPRRRRPAQSRSANSPEDERQRPTDPGDRARSRTPLRRGSAGSPSALVGDRQGRGAFREHLPSGAGEDRQAAVDPLAHLGALGKLRTESRRDGDASLVVDRVLILTCEHRAGRAPTVMTGRWRPGSSRLHANGRDDPPRPPRRWSYGTDSPLLPTWHHFVPLGWHDSPDEGVVKGSASSLQGRTRMGPSRGPAGGDPSGRWTGYLSLTGGGAAAGLGSPPSM